MAMQLGLGFGKGRRVIKTIYAGERLRMATAVLRAGPRTPPRRDSALDPVPADDHALTPRDKTSSPSSSSSSDREEP